MPVLRDTFKCEFCGDNVSDQGGGHFGDHLDPDSANPYAHQALCDPCCNDGYAWDRDNAEKRVGKAFIQIPLYDHTTIKEALNIIESLKALGFAQAPQLVLPE